MTTRPYASPGVANSITVVYTTDEASGISGWCVATADSMAEFLTYEEMLGLVAALTMPADFKDRRCLAWLETPQQRQSREERRIAREADRSAELLEGSGT